MKRLDQNAEFPSIRTRLINALHAEHEAHGDAFFIGSGRRFRALRLSENLESRFRLNGATAPADVYRNVADSLKPTAEDLLVVFAKLDALDTPLDEARGRIAYDRAKADLSAALQMPMTEQYQYSTTHVF